MIWSPLRRHARLTGYYWGNAFRIDGVEAREMDEAAHDLMFKSDKKEEKAKRERQFPKCGFAVSPVCIFD